MKMSAFKVELVVLSFLFFAVFGNAQFVGIQPISEPIATPFLVGMTVPNYPVYRQFGAEVEKLYINAANTCAVAYSNVTADIIRMRSSVCAASSSSSTTVVRILGVRQNSGVLFDSINSSLSPSMGGVADLMVVSFNPTSQKFEVTFRADSSLTIDTTKTISYLDSNSGPFCVGQLVGSQQCLYHRQLVHGRYHARLQRYVSALRDLSGWMSTRPASRVLITGHSSGGALATLAAMHLVRILNVPEARIDLITFSAPAVMYRENPMAYPTLNLHLRVTMCHDALVGPQGHPTAVFFNHVGTSITVENSKNSIEYTFDDFGTQKKILSWGMGEGINIQQIGMCPNPLMLQPVINHASLGNRAGFFYNCERR